MSQPADWLAQHAALLPVAGEALDIACGRGRHALWLAARGLWTWAVDQNPEAIAAVNAEAARRHLPVHAYVADLERPGFALDEACVDVVVGVHYLHRPLFPMLVRALRPGGLLVYETFTVAQAARGKPTNPAFLLRPGELRDLVQPLEIVAYREGDYDERSVASVIARRLPER